KRSERADFQCLNAVDHVVHRAGGGGEMENVTDFAAIEVTVDIELEKFKMTLAAQMLNIRQAAGQKIVDGNDRVAVRQQGIAEMRTEEPGASGDQYARSHERVLLLTFGACIEGPVGSGLTAFLPTL